MNLDHATRQATVHMERHRRAGSPSWRAWHLSHKGEGKRFGVLAESVELFSIDSRKVREASSRAVTRPGLQVRKTSLGWGRRLQARAGDGGPDLGPGGEEREWMGRGEEGPCGIGGFWLEVGADAWWVGCSGRRGPDPGLVHSALRSPRPSLHGGEVSRR